MPKNERRYIASGVRADCVELLERFKKLNSMRYDVFTNIWREMKFSYIYYGHNSFDELLEFTEEALRIAKDIWLQSECLNEKACGLYILYGLYLKQPTDGLVKIRLTSEEYDRVKQFHDLVRDEKHHDANYILSRMYAIGAFNFCISEYVNGIEKSYRKYYESDRSMQDIKQDPPYIMALRKEEYFLKLQESFNDYHKSKCELVSEHSTKPPQLLQYVDPGFAAELEKKFMSIMGPDQEQNPTAEVSSEGQKSSEASEFKLPWWMIPVQNRTERNSSSDSEIESDVDGDLQQLEKADASVERSLNVSLGLPVDEDEDDPGIVNENKAGPSGLNKSMDMPDVF